MTLTATLTATQNLAELYPERYQEVLEYQTWGKKFNKAAREHAEAVDEWAESAFTRKEYAAAYGYADWDESCEMSDSDDEDDYPQTAGLANPYWGAHMPYREQVTLALRIGYFEGLLTNKIDKQRFEVSSYYRLGQILGTAARNGLIPHDSYKAIVWAVDDEHSFNHSLPLGKGSYKLARKIMDSITTK